MALVRTPRMQRIATAQMLARLTALGTLAGCGAAGTTPEESVSQQMSAIVGGVPGDLNSDSHSDIALVGGIGWGSVPVAFSNGNGTFNVTNSAVTDFPQFAAQNGAEPVSGDFDGDGHFDIALTAGMVPGTTTPWGSIPVAFANGGGAFRVTNFAVANFPTLATQNGAKPVAGDFNGDGRWDIALVGGFLPGSSTPWASIPVAFSNGDGTFRVTNVAVADFPTFATQDGAKPVAGDFNGDGRADIALTGGIIPGGSTPWGSVPVAFSNGDGSFRVTNLANSSLPIFAAQRGATPVAGDFNGDGRGDIALTGGFLPGTTTPWGSVPVGFSNGDGTFRVTNLAVADFPSFATQKNAKAVAGDFNGDGRGDIALTGGFVPGTSNPWGSIPVAFSNGDGTFGVTNSAVSNFPIFATQTHAQPVGAWSAANDVGDLVTIVEGYQNISTETFAATSGDVLDQCITAGTHRVMRFNFHSKNVADSAVFLGAPPSSPNTPSSTFVWSQAHGHWHIRNFNVFSLTNTQNPSISRSGLKQAFCLEDFNRWSPAGGPAHFTCANQGVDPGWEDIYSASLPCQFVNMDGLPDGTYQFTAETNASQVAPESDYSNNKTTAFLRIQGNAVQVVPHP